MSPQTAQDLTGMMQRVVEEGTGTAAQLERLSVAGKTGTAETGVAGLNTAWFIAFAPVGPTRRSPWRSSSSTRRSSAAPSRRPSRRRVIEAYLGQGVAQ